LKPPPFPRYPWWPSRAKVVASGVARPNPLFDRDWYLALNPDITAAQVDPWQHYVEFGAAEGRDPNPLFHTSWYLKRYAGLIPFYSNPLLHYWERGVAEGCDPNPLFDSDWYLERYPDARARDLNPLLHYWRIGAARGYDPCAQFDTAWYLRANPDLSPGPLTPLGDYLRYGHLEGRSCLRSIDGNCPVARGQHRNGRAPGGRIAVYTAIVGDYDCLKVPTQVDPECDYYCFTDRDISWQGVWVRRDISWRHPDPVRTARRIKHNPHIYFAGYQWSIWLDANLQLNCLPQELMPAHSDTWDLAVWRHPYRDCAYAEAEQCVLEGKDDPATIGAQMQRYRNAGFPERAGLNENNVLVRRHNAPEMIDLARAWWAEIERGSRRDQLSFGFVARQRNPRIAHIGEAGHSARNDRRLRFFAHIQRRHEIRV
jgi:hypothetical protein